MILLHYDFVNRISSQGPKHTCESIDPLASSNVYKARIIIDTEFRSELIDCFRWKIKATHLGFLREFTGRLPQEAWAHPH